MEYKVFNAAGEHTAGDEVLDDVLKAAALLVNGWVEDATGQVVYTSPGRHAALEAEAERVRTEEAAQLAADEPESLTGVVTPPEEE
jgi:hypothetical protein